MEEKHTKRETLRLRSMEMPAFPALTRAKQRFLARTRNATTNPKMASHAVGDGQTAASPPALPSPRSSSSSLKTKDATTGDAHTLLLKLCADLDRDVRSLTHEVHVLDTAVRVERQRMCDDLDVLTTRFLDGKCFETPGTTPSRAARKRLVHVQKRPRTARKKLVVGVERAPKQPSRTNQPRPLLPTTRSRIALLALQAVHAHVIQYHFRRYLYTRLYSRGGKPQFTLAHAFRNRSVLRRRWRHWRSVLAQRKRQRRRFRLLAQRLRQRAHEISVVNAQQVVVCDGKYAMAKRFHEAKTLCRVFSAWLRALSA